MSRPRVLICGQVLSLPYRILTLTLTLTLILVLVFLAQCR